MLDPPATLRKLLERRQPLIPAQVAFEQPFQFRLKIRELISRTILVVAHGPPFPR